MRLPSRFLIQPLAKERPQERDALPASGLAMATSQQMFHNTETFPESGLHRAFPVAYLGVYGCRSRRDGPAAAKPRTKERGANARDVRRTMNNCRNTAVAFLLVAGIGFAANAAQAAAVVYEPFAFGQGDTSLNGNAGGTGLTGSWVAPTAGRGKHQSDLRRLPTSGSATVAKGWNSGSPRIGIAPARLNGLLDDGGELWMSFLYKYGADINHRFGIGSGTRTSL
jgi:hypothetical protein